MAAKKKSGRKSTRKKSTGKRAAKKGGRKSTRKKAGARKKR
jgi:hypothetical protein